MVENHFVETAFGRMGHLVATTFGSLRQLVENLSKIGQNLVEIGSKTDLYRKIKLFTYTVLTSPIYFHTSFSISISVFLVLKALICHFLGPPIASEMMVHAFHIKGAQWLSGRMLDSRPKGSGFEPHRRHCVVVLEQDTFILA